MSEASESLQLPTAGELGLTGVEAELYRALVTEQDIEAAVDIMVEHELDMHTVEGWFIREDIPLTRMNDQHMDLAA